MEINPKPVAIGRHEALSRGYKRKIHVFYLFFIGEYLGGEIKISDEHVSYKWVNLNKIKLEEYFKSGNLEGIEMYLEYEK